MSARRVFRPRHGVSAEIQCQSTGWTFAKSRSANSERLIASCICGENLSFIGKSVFSMREEFPDSIKHIVARRVNYLCSRPNCGAPTSGPQLDPSRCLNLGVAAHITAASALGPRYNIGLTSAQRKGADNAIWLCQNCAKLVDNDEVRFTETVLRGWKDSAERKALFRIGKTAKPQHSTVINRAYIEITDMRMGALHVDEMVIVKTTFLNVSRWPAWNFRFNSRLIFLEEPQAFKTEWLQNLTPRGRGKVLPPEKTSEQESPSNFIFAREQVEALINNTAKLFIAGELDYIDIAGTIQSSRFVRIYDPETGTFNEYEEV